ncbi:MAG TPA: class I SAM-dependent methyltransferase, partial [Pirellula sp.]|nr:class I SAM-dependent methyltransferase [Pirellula sp.]
MAQFSLHKPSALQLLLRRLRKIVAPPLSEGKLKSMAPKEIFSTICHENAWKGTQSVSGKGSDRDQTQLLVTELPKLFSKYGVCSVLDLPCGDFHWMQQVDLSGVRYVGGDIVSDLILQNESIYVRQNIRFACIDLLMDTLPEVDLIMCRDCLVHFSFAHIRQALKNIVASPAKFLLTTSFVDRT